MRPRYLLPLLLLVATPAVAQNKTLKTRQVEKTWKASMKKAELLEIAKEHDLPVNTKSTKAVILEALEGLL